MNVSEYYGLNAHQLNPTRFSTTSKVIETLPLHGKLQTLPRGTLINFLNRGVGVEIECEKAVSLPLRHRTWVCHRDSSLRGEALEWVTTYGLRIGGLWGALSNFKREVDKAREGYKDPTLYDFSERTSIHVHLDCRYFNEEQIKSLLVLYTLVENSLFRFAGEQRKHNVFCVPLRETDFSFSGFSAWGMVEDWAKYCAINIKCLREFGTVEFRHMEGHDDIERIFVWVTLLFLLQEAAKKKTKEEIREIISNIKGDSLYRVALNKIFYGFTDLLEWDERDIDTAASDAKLIFSELE